jgi:hypothetical protein
MGNSSSAGLGWNLERVPGLSSMPTAASGQALAKSHGEPQQRGTGRMEGLPAIWRGFPQVNGLLGRQCRLAGFWADAEAGSPAETKSIGQLNPALSRWLMGLPPVLARDGTVAGRPPARLRERHRRPTSGRVHFCVSECPRVSHCETAPTGTSAPPFPRPSTRSTAARTSSSLGRDRAGRRCESAKDSKDLRGAYSERP